MSQAKNLSPIMKNQSVLLTAAVCVFAASGCNQSETQNPLAQNNAPPADAGHSHAGEMPDGGTPVQVGPHDYHLELVNDPSEGRMTAFVLDEHSEKPKTVSPTTFELIARMVGAEHRLTFNPLTNASATSISAFSAQADWLKTATNFEGTIPKISLSGESFENITFTYPKGKKHSH